MQITMINRMIEGDFKFNFALLLYACIKVVVDFMK